MFPTWKFPRCQDELVFDVCWGGKMLWSSTRNIKPLRAQKGREGLSISNCMFLNSPLKVSPDWVSDSSFLTLVSSRGYSYLLHLPPHGGSFPGSETVWTLLGSPAMGSLPSALRETLRSLWPHWLQSQNCQDGFLGSWAAPMTCR